MRAVISQTLSFAVVLIFPLLFFGGLLVQRITNSVRRDLILTQYELERGPIEKAPEPPPADQLIPGYKLMTKDDYREILAKVTGEMKSDK